MRWEKIVDDQVEPYAPVVRALSFSKRTEDGFVVAAVDRQCPLRSQTSFTSFDVKKSRRIARSREPMASTATLPHAARKSQLTTQSLQRPAKINKLVLRVPSDASEYKHCRVIHSTCVVPQTEGDGAQRRLSPSISVVSQACQTNVPFNYPEHIFSSTLFNADESIAADLGSCSISNLSSGDAVSTQSRVSTFADDFSTPTRMGSTTRLVQTKKTPLSQPETRLLSVPLSACEMLRFCDDLVNAAFSEAKFILLREARRKNQFSCNDSLDRNETNRQLRGRVHEIIAQFELQCNPSTARPKIFYIGENDSENNFLSRSYSNSVLSVVSDSSPKARCGRCWENEHLTTFLCVLSFACSLGNLLRLPRMVFFHGGGVFLLVYALMTFIFGLPLMFLEIGLGQFCQHGTVKLWRAVNLFRGVGYVKTFLAFLLVIVYSVQIGFALSVMSAAIFNFLPHDNFTTAGREDFAYLIGEDSYKTWLMRVFFVSALWVLVFLSIIRRSVTYRKIMYLLFPSCLALTIALFATVDTVDLTNGLNKLFTFNWAALGDTQVWYFATVQMFFSLQLGFGCVGTCAGKTFPKTNALWAGWCVICSNVFLGVAWVVLVYAWMENIPVEAFSTSEEFFFVLIDQLVRNGSRLVVWAACLLVFVVGMASLVPVVYSLVISASVELKKKLRWRHLNLIVTASACLLACFTFIPGAFSIIHAVEHYAIAHGVLALTILELVGFGMIYGCKNVYNDLEFVIGSKLGSTWKSLWLVTPCILFVIELCSAFLLPLNGEAGFKGDPMWLMTLGWVIYLFSWIIFLACGIYQIWIQVDYNFTQKILSAMKPSRNWGPVDPIYRHCWVQWRNRYLMTGSRDFTLKRRGTRDYTHRARTALSKSDSQWPHSVQSIY